MTTVVEQGGTLREVNLAEVGPSTARWLEWPMIGGSVPFDPGPGGWLPGWWGGDYVALYEHQPEVRTCIDFLARNIAQIGQKVYRRLADDDREHLYDHPLAATLRTPSQLTSRYWWVYGLVADLATFDEHYSVVAQDGETIALQRIPVPAVTPVEDGPAPPRAYEVRLGGDTRRITAANMFAVHGYNPGRLNRGLAPLDTLAALLREEAAATAERTRYFSNASMIHGTINRPVDAPKWSDPARERFRSDWDNRFSGPANTGKTPILEDGMEFKPQSFSPLESQFVEGRKLAREEVARAYHIPPPMVGILDHATFSNISEQHRMLYQDTLGPWLEMIVEEIERQLLPRYTDRDGVYVEFNLATKLQGSFEQQVQAISTAVGRPYLTANEGRSILNLPRIDTRDADALVLPLNVTTSGAPPEEEAGPPPAEEPGAPTTLASLPGPVVPGREEKATPRLRRWVAGVARARDRHVKAYESLLTGYFRRQSDAVDGRLDRISSARWNRELSIVLRGLHEITADDLARLVVERFGLEGFDAARMSAYLDNAARIDAEGINATTASRVEKAMGAEDAPSFSEAYKAQTGFRVATLAATYATSYGMFGQHEAAQQGDLAVKVWIVSSARSRHPELNGEQQPVGMPFSNGAAYPGDAAAGADETSGCSCLLDWAT